MNKEKHTITDNHLSATAEIVSSYLLNHKTEMGDLELLIQRVYSAVSRVSNTEKAESGAQTPSGQSIEDSIGADYIVCLEDGKKLKMLKRYLKTHYDMTPEEYRKRWGLPASYPMVAPNYAKRRSQLAKQIGLGRKKAVSKTRPLSGTHKHFKVVKGSQVAALAEIAEVRITSNLRSMAPGHDLMAGRFVWI